VYSQFTSSTNRKNSITIANIIISQSNHNRNRICPNILQLARERKVNLAFTLFIGDREALQSNKDPKVKAEPEKLLADSISRGAIVFSAH